jgi:hypothetical protein
MVRGILGVIFGYVVMFTVSFITLSATYMVLGQDRTFQIGSYLLTPLWLVFNAVFGLAAAVIAGKVCRLISGSGVVVYVMALSVFVLSLALAVPVLLGAEGTAPRTGEVSNFQAMASGKAPKWFALLSPFLSAGGVIIGGKQKKR